MTENLPSITEMINRFECSQQAQGLKRLTPMPNTYPYTMQLSGAIKALLKEFLEASGFPVPHDYFEELHTQLFRKYTGLSLLSSPF